MQNRTTLILLSLGLLLLTAGCANRLPFGSAEWVEARSSTRTGRTHVSLDHSPAMRAASGEHGTTARLVRVRGSEELGICVRIVSIKRRNSGFESAMDAQGRMFPVKEIGRAQLVGGRELQSVCASLGSDYLLSQREKGFSLRLEGARRSRTIDVSPAWIEGFLAYAGESQNGDEESAQLGLRQ